MIGALAKEAVKYGGPAVLLWLFADAAKSGADVAQAGEQSVDHVTKVAPWIVAGLAVYLIARRA